MKMVKFLDGYYYEDVYIKNVNIFNKLSYKDRVNLIFNNFKDIILVKFECRFLYQLDYKNMKISKFKFSGDDAVLFRNITSFIYNNKIKLDNKQARAFNRYIKSIDYNSKDFNIIKKETFNYLINL